MSSMSSNAMTMSTRLRTRLKAVEVAAHYDKQMRAPGDEYEMDDREEGSAKILQTLGRLEIIEHAKPDVGKAATYETAEMKAEEKTDDPDASVEPMTTENTDALTPSKRVYRRRDMKAEGEK